MRAFYTSQKMKAKRLAEQVRKAPELTPEERAASQAKVDDAVANYLRQLERLEAMKKK